MCKGSSSALSVMLTLTMHLKTAFPPARLICDFIVAWQSGVLVKRAPAFGRGELSNPPTLCLGWRMGLQFVLRGPNKTVKHSLILSMPTAGATWAHD